MLGDVVIACPRAQEQAVEAGHPLAAEIQLLVVHGVLHLLGYDHAQPEEKAVMWARQDEILHTLRETGGGPALRLRSGQASPLQAGD